MPRRSKVPPPDWATLGELVRIDEPDTVVSAVRSGTGSGAPDRALFEMVVALDTGGSYLLRSRSDQLRVERGTRATHVAVLELDVTTRQGRGFTAVVRARAPDGPTAGPTLARALAHRICEEAEALREVFGLARRAGPGPDWPIEL